MSILRKAQLYEHTIMHRKNDCKSNIEVRNIRNSEHMKLFSSPLQHENALIKRYNRSGIYISSKGTNFCDIILSNSQDETVVPLKKQKTKRNKKNIKFQKFEIKDDRIEQFISIDKL